MVAAGDVLMSIWLHCAWVSEVAHSQAGEKNSAQAEAGIEPKTLKLSTIAKMVERFTTPFMVHPRNACRNVS